MYNFFYIFIEKKCKTNTYRQQLSGYYKKEHVNDLILTEIRFFLQ